MRPQTIVDTRPPSPLRALGDRGLSQNQPAWAGGPSATRPYRKQKGLLAGHDGDDDYDGFGDDEPLMFDEKEMLMYEMDEVGRRSRPPAPSTSSIHLHLHLHLTRD